MKFFKELILFMLLIAVSCNQPIKKIGLSYGAFLRPEGIEFRIFAPSSDIVDLIIFSKPEDDFGTAYSMERLANGDWSFFLDDSGAGTIYGYRLKGPLNDDKVIVADPYSRATITQNKWRHVAKSLVVDEPFNWEGDTWMNIHPRDLIIYETHVRDMTAHISSGANSRGSYLGFIEENQIVKNMSAISDIPGRIVHGRYDILCPLNNANTLHHHWQKSELHIVRDAGHSASEPGTVDALMRATQDIAKELQQAG